MVSFRWFRRDVADAPQAKAPVTLAALTPAQLQARLAEADKAYAAGDVAGACDILQEVNASNPRNAQVLTKLGIGLADQGDFDGGRECLAGAVQIDPKNTLALKKLALIYLDRRDFPPALESALAVLSVASGDAEAYALAASACLCMGNMEEAIRYINLGWERAPESPLLMYMFDCTAQEMLCRTDRIERHPGIGAARRRVLNRLRSQYRRNALGVNDLTHFIGILSGSQETFDEAHRVAAEAAAFEPMIPELASQIERVLFAAGDIERLTAFARSGFEADPNNVSRRFMIGSAWIASGSDQWNAGWRMMTEAYFIGRPFLHPHSVPIWEGQPVGKKKLFVYQEQGLGDAILCFRFLAELARRNLRFELWVNPSLADVAAQVPGIETLHRSEVVRFPDPKEVAYSVGLFGLISAMHLQFDEIRDPPQIRMPRDYALGLRQRVAALPGIKIGLLPGGNPKRRDDWMRSPPVSWIEQLRQIPGVSWVNLMIDDSPVRTRAGEALEMLDLMPEVKNFGETAAIVEELDAVVAVDASVAHLAAILGKPLWVLLPVQRDWRWQIGESASPWWPSAKVFRTHAAGKWDIALEELQQDLLEFVRRRGAPVKA